MVLLLRTKTSIPPARPRQVERARLLSRVDEGMLRALTLVMAPAGFGKTTLLTNWAQSTAIPIAWLSLDAGDKNPAHFLAYLIQAFQQVSPKIGKTTLALLHGGQEITKDGMLYSLVNDLSDVSGEFALIMDDYHSADTPQIGEIVQFLLEQRPNNFHIVLLSRSAPSLSLARLQALDQAIEISSDDLRFSNNEILLFLEESMGLKLPAEDLSRLSQSTEGWAVGLQLAALALSRQTIDWELPVGQASIFAYLAQEVLRHEPASVQQFLLRISIFDRFCASLCQILLDTEPKIETSAAELLDYVERANLFLFPLDATGIWYRFHALFADFLRQQFEKHASEQIPRLYRQASQWFEEQGILDEAVHYAIHAQDFERAAAILENHYREILQHSQQNALLEWLSEIPVMVMEDRPLLWLIKGWACAIAFDTAQARVCADHFERLAAPHKMTTQHQGELEALRIFAAIIEGENHTIEETSRLSGLLSEQDDFLQLLLYLNWGMASALAGETGPAIDAFSKTLSLTPAFDNPLITTISSAHKAETHTIRGEFAAAEEAFRWSIHYIKDKLGENSFLLCIPYTGYAEFLREQNRFDEARQYAEQGIHYSRYWQFASLDGRVVLARLQAGLGNWGQAYEQLERAIQIAQTSETILDDLIATLHFVRLKLLQGDLAQAVYWANIHKIETRVGSMPYFIQELSQIVQLRIRVLNLENDPTPARQLVAQLDGVIGEAQRRGRKTSVIEALILRATAWQAAGDIEELEATLWQALALGAESGYVRIFADEGPRLYQFLERYRSRLSDLGPYLEMLLTIMREASPAVAKPAPHIQGLIPLTRRELEVLHQIAMGKSNHEIADELVLTLNTVKKHVANILRKLEVTNRTQAVAVSKERGWLE